MVAMTEEYDKAYRELQEWVKKAKERGLLPYHVVSALEYVKKEVMDITTVKKG